MKYPRVWVYKDHLWFQKSEDDPLLHVVMVDVIGVVRTSTFTPDQLSSQPVEVEAAHAALAAKENQS